MTRRRLLPIVLAATLTTATLASVAIGNSFNVGNAAVDRPILDTFFAFSIVDTAATAPSDGVVTGIHYYAKVNTGSFRFVLIDSTASGQVLWVSDDIAPSAVGTATYTPPVPIPVQAGNAIAIYFDSTGVIPFTLNSPTFEGSGPDRFTRINKPTPTAGSTLPFNGITDRDYSYNADVQPCTFGIGQPINADGSSLFNARRGVIPVKLTGCDNPDLAPDVSVTQITGSSPGPVDISSVSAADTGTTMRFDSIDGQYIYNLSTANLAPGTYTLQISVSGLTVVSVEFGIH